MLGWAFARIGVRGTLSVSRTVGVVRAATVGVLPDWNSPFWTTRGTKRHEAARRVTFPEYSTMAGAGQASAGPLRAAGGHLTGERRTPARREPAQTPAPDTRERDAGGTGACSPIGLACQGPPRTNRTVGVVGLKPGGRYPENPDSWSPRCPLISGIEPGLGDHTGCRHRCGRSPGQSRSNPPSPRSATGPPWRYPGPCPSRAARAARPPTAPPPSTAPTSPAATSCTGLLRANRPARCATGAPAP